jgi:hypothetical protein
MRKQNASRIYRRLQNLYQDHCLKDMPLEEGLAKRRKGAKELCLPRSCLLVVKYPTISYMTLLMPLKKTSSIPVFQRLHGVALTLAADELLLDGVQIMSEGSVDMENSEETYNGTTMISVNLDRPDIDLSFDKGTMDALGVALSNSILFRTRLMRMARIEAERRVAPRLLTGMLAETEFRIEEKQLFVDIEIECPLEPAARESGSSTGNDS